jgi:hypothetical protein
MKEFLLFLAGYITHAILMDQKVRRSILYFLRLEFIAIFKPNQKQNYLIRYHDNFRKPPKGHRRIHPPQKHSGGPVEQAIDKAARPLLEAGKSPPEVWEILAPDFFTKAMREDIDTISGMRKNTLRRWRRKRYTKTL